MTISKYHKLFVLSALVCAIPVSNAYSGPAATKVWGLLNDYITSKVKSSQSQYNIFSRDWNNTVSSFPSDFLSNNSTGSRDSSVSNSEWFSTNTLLVGAVAAGAAVVAGGYALYKCYSSYKQREQAEHEQAEREQAERRKAAADEVDYLMGVSDQRRLKKQVGQELVERFAKQKADRKERKAREVREAAEKDKRIKEALQARLVSEQKLDLIPLEKIESERQRYQEKKRLRLRESKLKLTTVNSMFDSMGSAAQAESDDEDFVHCDETGTLSERVKNCSLCNQLTVDYLNNLYKDHGKDDKKQVIGFLTGVTALGSEQSSWSNRNIMPFINNGGTSFVMDRLEYIAKGESYVRAITSGNTHLVPQSNQNEYLDSIISITWYFYAKALQKGDGFSKSGSFNIQSKALMDFFMGYYHKVREWHVSFDSSPRAVVGSRVGLGDNPFVYKRVSSHLKELKKINYGLDIRFSTESGDVANSQALLPDDKAHLLFMPYDEKTGRFLLKPEACGTSAFDVTETVEHGLEFLHGSKDNDYGYTRREKIKKDVLLQKFIVQYEKHVPGQEARSGVRDIEMIQVYGVQHMLQRLDHWLAKGNIGLTTRDKMSHLRKNIIKAYTDNHDIRFAHEVVFKENDFR